MFKFKEINEKKSNEFIIKIDKSRPFCTYTIIANVQQKLVKSFIKSYFLVYNY